MAAKKNSLPGVDNTLVQEAYRTLRANVLFCSCEEKIKTIAIVSCNPGEGKTTTAINLAICMAKSGKKVLLVDTDLRKPSKIKWLNCKNEVGLSNLISQSTTLEEAINTTNTPNLHFIGCGPEPPNPTEMLESRRFMEFSDEARLKYDVVIFDTPPLGSVIDSAIIASQTDGTILVVKSKSVALTNIERAKEQLEKAGARILGAVLNNVSKKEYKSLYSHYNYYRHIRSSKGAAGWMKVFSKHRKINL